jgi:hypothetical protein
MASEPCACTLKWWEKNADGSMMRGNYSQIWTHRSNSTKRQILNLHYFEDYESYNQIFIILHQL